MTSRGDAMLVDTLYDLNLTRRMLDAMRRRTPAAENIATVVNTHANGDHCWGNQLVAGAEIVASRRAAAEMRELSPALMKTLVRASRLASRLRAGASDARPTCSGAWASRAPRRSAEAAQFVVDKFGVFDFEGIETDPPDDDVRWPHDPPGRRQGSAPHRGRPRPHAAATRSCMSRPTAIVFSGDILFIGSHPIVWDGPVSNWIRACDRILDLDVDTIVVPGHGPLTDKAGVRRVKEYWEYLLAETRDRFDAGLSAEEAARDIALEGFSGWLDGERVAVNVDTIYRELSGDRSKRDPLAMLARMARFAAASR